MASSTQEPSGKFRTAGIVSELILFELHTIGSGKPVLSDIPGEASCMWTNVASPKIEVFESPDPGILETSSDNLTVTVLALPRLYGSVPWATTVVESKINNTNLIIDIEIPFAGQHKNSFHPI